MPGFHHTLKERHIFWLVSSIFLCLIHLEYYVYLNFCYESVPPPNYLSFLVILCLYAGFICNQSHTPHLFSPFFLLFSSSPLQYEFIDVPCISPTFLWHSFFPLLTKTFWSDCQSACKGHITRTAPMSPLRSLQDLGWCKIKKENTYNTPSSNQKTL